MANTPKKAQIKVTDQPVVDKHQTHALQTELRKGERGFGPSNGQPKDPQTVTYSAGPGATPNNHPVLAKSPQYAGLTEQVTPVAANSEEGKKQFAHQMTLQMDKQLQEERVFNPSPMGPAAGA